MNSKIRQAVVSGVDDAIRLQAVRTRDSTADGTFFYGVTTTGIYCYPSCPSRVAQAENMRFFDARADAKRAGFRPCRRCQADELPPAERRAELVVRACRLLESDEPHAIDDIAACLDTNRRFLQRAFREATGLTPKAWQLAARRGRLDAIVRDNSRITDAAFDGGYSSASRFHNDARERLGMTPSVLRAGGSGEKIRYAVTNSSLGRTIVAWTNRGICCIALGEDDKDLVNDLAARFSAAQLIADDGEGLVLVQQVIDRVEGIPSAAELPLDIRGTAFQEKVWRALQQIPVGTTASYADVARVIDKPSASRAVAQACGANPLAVLVPCHRVVRADGTLSGYRWGVDKKAELLKREAIKRIS